MKQAGAGNGKSLTGEQAQHINANVWYGFILHACSHAASLFLMLWFVILCQRLIKSLVFFFIPNETPLCFGFHFSGGYILLAVMTKDVV